MQQEFPFRIFSNCIPVKGHSRSTICDLQGNKIHLIPNSLFEIISACDGSSLSQIKQKYGLENSEVIEEYFNFLDQHELIFFTPNPAWFPPMNLEWKSPFKINNCIIDIDENSEIDFNRVITDLNELDCQFIEIRTYFPFPINTYIDLLNHIKGTTIVSVGLLAACHEKIELAQWSELCDDFPRITSLNVHSCKDPEMFSSEKLATPIIFSDKTIKNETCCGVISEAYFTSYTETFTEAMKHNSCLNRKISIDRKGEIKNCPSMKERFGNIKNTTLIEAISQPGFKKYWDITKDQINKCKDCEFRYVCTDCRAYVESPKDIYSAPVKCGYNPYTCVWEEWSTNPLKEKAIAFYKL